MKIAILMPVFITGGAEIMAKRLAAHLDKKEFDVEVISIYPPQNNDLEESIRKEGIPLHFVGKEKGNELTAVIQLGKLLSEIKPDVIHSHLRSTFYALPWAAIHRVPLLHTIHNQPEKEFTPKLRKILDISHKLGILNFAAISKTNQELVSKYYNIPLDCVPWVNNPVETELYYRNLERNDQDVVYINLGRFQRTKNQAMAIHAMPEVLRHVPNAKLWLFGDGPLKSELENLISELDLTTVVSLPGQCEQPEHPLANADVYISTSHWEGLPLSILEAEAAYLPVIATRVGGVPDIVRENGVLYSDNDLDALVREMVRFGTNETLRQQAGQLSREIATEYDAEHCAQSYGQIYKKLRTR